MATKGRKKGLEGAGQEVKPPASLKDYTVLKFMTKRSHGMKPYEVDSVIQLTDAEAAPLVQNGFVRLRKQQPKKGKE